MPFCRKIEEILSYMPLKSALLRNFGGCCFAVTLLKVAFMVIRGDHSILSKHTRFTKYTK